MNSFDRGRGGLGHVPLTRHGGAFLLKGKTVNMLMGTHTGEHPIA